MWAIMAQVGETFSSAVGLAIATQTKRRYDGAHHKSILMGDCDDWCSLAARHGGVDSRGVVISSRPRAKGSGEKESGGESRLYVRQGRCGTAARADHRRFDLDWIPTAAAR